MFYKPEKGGIWDPSVLYCNGKYYMACMYFKDDEPRRDNYMWLACSSDAVHWEDIGVVIEDKYNVCKMFIYETDDSVIADFGSGSEVPMTNNDTMRFYKTQDMINWEYIGKNHPDGKWYNPEGRWDHMYVYKENGKYYGYPVATPHPEFLSAWGICTSCDGIKWNIQKPPVIEWGDVPPIDCLEVGGMEKIGDKYYFIGGFVGYANNYGYALYTFVADSPEGPFRPDKGAFRLCGFDRLEGRIFVQNLAAFARGENGELLISNAVDAGGSHEIWLLPMRKAVVDEYGHLRMGYWYGNEKAKGKEILIDKDSFSIAFSSYPEGSEMPSDKYHPSAFKPLSRGFEANTDVPDYPNCTDHNMIILINENINSEEGIILEGTVTAESYLPYDEINHKTLMWRPSSFGIFAEEESGSDKCRGMDIALEIGHPYKRYSFVENIRSDGKSVYREIVDTIGEDCADVRGISANEKHTFKFLYRRNIFELYADDIHVQTFVHLGKQTGRIGFTLLNSHVKIENLKMYKMNLAD